MKICDMMKRQTNQKENRIMLKSVPVILATFFGVLLVVLASVATAQTIDTRFKEVAIEIVDTDDNLKKKLGTSDSKAYQLNIVLYNTGIERSVSLELNVIDTEGNYLFCVHPTEVESLGKKCNIQLGSGPLLLDTGRNSIIYYFRREFFETLSGKYTIYLGVWKALSDDQIEKCRNLGISDELCDCIGVKGYSPGIDRNDRDVLLATKEFCGGLESEYKFLSNENYGSISLINPEIGYAIIRPRVGYQDTKFELEAEMSRMEGSWGWIFIRPAPTPIAFASPLPKPEDYIPIDFIRKEVRGKYDFQGQYFYSCELSNCAGKKWDISNPGDYEVWLAVGGSTQYTPFTLIGDWKQNKVYRFKIIPAYSKEQRCQDVVKSGDPKDKLDIVFVPHGYVDLAEFADDVDEHTKLLLSTEPFARNKDKINIHRVDLFQDLGCKILDVVLFGAFGGRNVAICDNEKVSIISSFCPNDYVIVLWDGYDKGSGGSHAVSSGREPFVTVHEFGHTFGGLKDEYVHGGIGSEIDSKKMINCDIDPECSKWKHIEGTECVKGCFFENFYRSIKSGIMRDLYARNFGIYNEIQIEKKLANYK